MDSRKGKEKGSGNDESKVVEDGKSPKRGADDDVVMESCVV